MVWCAKSQMTDCKISELHLNSIRRGNVVPVLNYAPHHETYGGAKLGGE